MNHNKNSEKEKSEKKKNQNDDEQQKWFAQGDLQDLAKIGGDILKKTVATGIDVIKEVKDNFPKDATQFIVKGKDEIIKGLTQEMAKSMISFGIEKFFSVARQHKVEFTIRVRKNENKGSKRKILRKKA
ncbi:hypothetical protein [Fluviispira multicolorata]|uniref:Uncharacterized protein n=1 Tax=Fluviispira multicolorata TaxID=2654512 RepID=A0A833JDP6_9BACT|nr:hypothetical protein [Fluviispira multicolorata]KAB8031889.1 hypothetical protein GCL57_04390 [Fluviispira multicolorata]